MKWTPTRTNRNMRDARTGRGGSRTARQGRGGVAMGAGGISIVALVLALFFGVDISGMSQSPGAGMGNVAGPSTHSAPAPQLTGQREQFFNFLLGDIQDFWVQKFADSDVRYQEATLTLYDSPIRTGCGSATAAIGPHYCPLDKGIYLELGFFDAILANRFGAAGDFAEAYVVAHEFGHHVQNELGISTWVRQQQQSDPRNKNEYSVRLELQADCLAGVWAYTAEQRGLLDPGDVREALDAAAAVGDDRIQAQSGQRVNPHTWTHGSAEQRMHWFNQGFHTGDTEVCDTF